MFIVKTFGWYIQAEYFTAEYLKDIFENVDNQNIIYLFRNLFFSVSCNICYFLFVIDSLLCVCERRDTCQTELRELRLTLKSIESQQKTLMSNIDDDIYLAVKHVYDKVSFSCP